MQGKKLKDSAAKFWSKHWIYPRQALEHIAADMVIHLYAVQKNRITSENMEYSSKYLLNIFLQILSYNLSNTTQTALYFLHTKKFSDTLTHISLWKFEEYAASKVMIVLAWQKLSIHYLLYRIWNSLIIKIIRRWRHQWKPMGSE